MKSGMTIAHVQSILEREFGAVTYNPPTTWYVGVSSTLIQEDGTGATEPTDGAYARVAVLNNVANWEDMANGRGRQNVNLIEFPRAQVDWPTIVSLGLYTTSTGGAPVHFADLEFSKIVQFNDSLIIEPGELQVDIAPLVV